MELESLIEIKVAAFGVTEACKGSTGEHWFQINELPMPGLIAYALCERCGMTLEVRFSASGS